MSVHRSSSTRPWRCGAVRSTSTPGDHNDLERPRDGSPDRGRRPRRPSSAKALDDHLTAGQADHVQDQARSDRGLRGRRAYRVPTSPSASDRLRLAPSGSTPRAVQRGPYVGVIGAFPMAERRRLFTRCQAIGNDFDGPPPGLAAHRRRADAAQERGLSVGTRVKDLVVPTYPLAARKRVVRRSANDQWKRARFFPPTPPSSQRGAPTASPLLRVNARSSNTRHLSLDDIVPRACNTDVL